MKHPTAIIATLAVASVYLLAGCSSSDEGIDNYEQTELEPVEVAPEPPVEYVEPAVERWECYWDPTMNDDWHDDYMCTNGSAYDRPYLIPDDSFVEQWEIDEAASAYEAELNL
ncbi:hypothetical protein ACWGST_03020 [Agromyces sp. NPDC055520]